MELLCLEDVDCRTPCSCALANNVRSPKLGRHCLCGLSYNSTCGWPRKACRVIFTRKTRHCIHGRPGVDSVRRATMSTPISPAGILLVNQSSSRKGVTGEGDRSRHSGNGGGGGDGGSFFNPTTRASTSPQLATPRHIANLRYEADQKVDWVAKPIDSYATLRELAISCCFPRSLFVMDVVFRSGVY